MDEIKADLEKDLEEIVQWTFRWRTKLNVEKKEFCVFTRNKNHEDRAVTITTDEKETKRMEIRSF